MFCGKITPTMTAQGYGPITVDESNSMKPFWDGLITGQFMRNPNVSKDSIGRLMTQSEFVFDKPLQYVAIICIYIYIYMNIYDYLNNIYRYRATESNASTTPSYKSAPTRIEVSNIKKPLGCVNRNCHSMNSSSTKEVTVYHYANRFRVEIFPSQQKNTLTPENQRGTQELMVWVDVSPPPKSIFR